jgi:hypothetical protein
MSNPQTTAEHPAGISWANEVTPGGAEVKVPLPPAGSAEADAGGTAPALNPPTWSGRKTAIAAALAIGLSTAGALGAAAAVQPGSGATDQGQFQPGGFGRGQRGPGRFGGRLPNQQQQQIPNQSQLPGQQAPGQQLPGQADPNASTT